MQGSSMRSHTLDFFTWLLDRVLSKRMEECRASEQSHCHFSWPEEVTKSVKIPKEEKQTLFLGGRTCKITNGVAMMAERTLATFGSPAVWDMLIDDMSYVQLCKANICPTHFTHFFSWIGNVLLGNNIVIAIVKANTIYNKKLGPYGHWFILVKSAAKL